MSHVSLLRAVWIDGGREPRNPPNPAYPDGIDVDLSNGATRACSVQLRHPAPRCGTYLVVCRACGVRVAVTTAGRADDPRTVTVACKPNA